MDFAQLFSAGTTLILTVNPLSGLPFVLSARSRAEDPHHETGVRRIALTVALGTLCAALCGYRVLALFGVSPAAFMVGAGLLLAGTGAQKFAAGRATPPAVPAAKKRATRKTASGEPPAPSLSTLAIAPIGFPVLVGPGVLAVGALNGSMFGDSPEGIAVNVALSVVAGAVVYLAYRAASRLQEVMQRWEATVTCVIGLVLLCRGVEIVIHGLRAV